ncbi:DM13 domain-containing protein [Candidatus Pacearchaeota archaeon]|nr:DM13 domain-containing protein [Candidatus Pacearchaeota archaeon]
MKKSYLIIGIIILILIIAGASYYYKTAKNVIEMNEELPSVESSNIIASGDFMRKVHAVSGRAVLIEDSGDKILRFEDFETDNGPNLHIYLASDLSADDFIDLGEIKATKGNVNYPLPQNIDTEKYNKVLVWCQPFKVLFSYAELESE